MLRSRSGKLCRLSTCSTEWVRAALVTCLHLFIKKSRDQFPFVIREAATDESQSPGCCSSASLNITEQTHQRPAFSYLYRGLSLKVQNKNNFIKVPSFHVQNNVFSQILFPSLPLLSLLPLQF